MKNKEMILLAVIFAFAILVLIAFYGKILIKAPATYLFPKTVPTPTETIVFPSPTIDPSVQRKLELKQDLKTADEKIKNFEDENRNLFPPTFFFDLP